MCFVKISFSSANAYCRFRKQFSKYIDSWSEEYDPLVFDSFSFYEDYCELNLSSAEDVMVLPDPSTGFLSLCVSLGNLSTHTSEIYWFRLYSGKIVSVLQR